MQPPLTTRSPARILVPLLLLLSGFCGISYEILYARLLGNLLGNQFTINATVLLSFLLGIGLGTLWAWRFTRLLWLIELGIGLYAAGIAAAYPLLDRLLYDGLPWIGRSLQGAAVTSLVLLAVPAFLIGCSVPLFAAWLGTQRRGRVFAATYAIYNVGAAVTALAMEFVLLRSVGLRDATWIIAALNAVVGLGLLVLLRRGLVVPPEPVSRLRLPARSLAALALASVVSAIFQLSMIKLGEFIFGPHNETFALVLATALLGIAAGAFMAARTGLTFGGAVLLAAAGLAGLLALLPAVITFWAWSYPVAVASYPLLVLLKLVTVVVMMGLPAVGFGATIPALLSIHQDVARESGQLLFVSSIANAAGFLLMAFVLHRHLDYGPMLILCALGAALAAGIQAGWRRPAALGAAAAAVLAIVAWATVWDETLLYAGHTNFSSLASLRAQRASRFSAEAFKDGQDVFAITSYDNVPYLFINGFVSNPLAGELATEEVVGALSSMHAPRADNALVLGLGSGATAGTVGLIFDRADVVEINGGILENLELLARYSFDLQIQPTVSIFHDDGIHFIRTGTDRYSMILNTVTSPIYFSSSKLYTLDFFDHVKRRLTPDGIYVTWVDGTIGDTGLDIILETLAARFAHCWLSYLTTEYYFLVCSDEEPGLHQFQRVLDNRRLRRYFEQHYAVPMRFLPYGVISTDALALRSPQAAPVNTIDFPVLEFEMTRLSEPDEGWLAAFKERLAAQFDLERLERDVGRHVPWSRAEFALFGDLRSLPGWTLDLMFREAERRQGLDPAAYDAAAWAYADRLDTEDAALAAADALIGRQRWEAAGALLDSMVLRHPRLARHEDYLEAREKVGRMASP